MWRTVVVQCVGKIGQQIFTQEPDKAEKKSMETQPLISDQYISLQAVNSSAAPVSVDGANMNHLIVKAKRLYLH